MDANMSPHRDVVVTGMGAVTSLGVGVSPLWAAVRGGRSGVDWLSFAEDLDPNQFPVRFAGEVKNFDVEQHLSRNCEVRHEKGVQMGLVAGQEALRQARLINQQDRLHDEDQVISAYVGSGQGASHESELVCHKFKARGVRGLRPSTVPKCMFNAFSSNLSVYFGLKGANHTTASACSSGAATIGMAYRDIKHGYADIVLCGGADSPLNSVVFACWTSLRVLAKASEPFTACKPFDKHRHGMVLGEGAGMLVLESRESAEQRGAPILARVMGYGTSSDAYHLTAPKRAGQVAAIRACLADGRVSPDEVDYISMHGTGTKANDETEAQAVREVFGPRKGTLPCSSIKPIVGHSLGAIGTIEVIVCIKVVQNSFVPPTINCVEPDPNIELDYVEYEGREHDVRLAMSNSFAFGGSNACVLLEKPA
jgi:3-oxoacyl-(acyl-carrier-protein) synthase